MLIFVAWEVLQALGFGVRRLEHHKIICGLGTQGWGFAPIYVWAKNMENFGHEMDGDDRGWREKSNTSRIVEF